MHRLRRGTALKQVAQAGEVGGLLSSNTSTPSRASQLFGSRTIFQSAKTRSLFTNSGLAKGKIKSGRNKFLSHKKVKEPRTRQYNTEAQQQTVAEELPLPEGEHYAFWLNFIYPVKRNRLDLRAWLVGNYERKIHSVFPPEAQIELMQRVIKEGGVYAHFVTEPGVSVAEHASKMLKYLREHPRRMYPFATNTPKAYLVKGKPFIEDISARLPSAKLNVQFKGPDILLDDLYRLFRPYGKIRDMEIPRGQLKDELRSALIYMETVEGAIAARNCLHNLQHNNTTILISYESFQPISYLQNMFTKHPRIMFPVVGVVATGTTYLLFDPLRVYSIYRRRLVRPHPITGWTKREKETAPQVEAAIIKEAVAYRKDDVKKVQNYFKQQPNAVLSITAPPGSGISPLIKGAVVGRKKTIIVHCDGLATVEAFIEEFCSSVAFAPSFYYLNQMGNYVDALIPSSKNFFSQPPVAQMQAVLMNLQHALRRAALTPLAHGDEEDQYPVIIFDGLSKMLKGMPGNENAEHVVDHLYSWATEMSSKNKYAHVVFVGDDIFFATAMRKHVEQAGGRMDFMSVDDVGPDVSRRLIVDKLKTNGIELTEEDIAFAIASIGGRMMDIDLFCRKVKSGLSAHDAVSQMASEAINVIRNEGFDQKDTATLDAKDKSKSQPPWLKSQLWESIQKIAMKDKVDYDELLYTTFNGDEKALHALIKANMLRLTYKDSNKIESVTAFSPLYAYSFKKMVSNPKMSAGIGIVVKKFEIEQETMKMNKILDEMVKLRSLVYKGYLWGDIESEAVKSRRTMLEKKLDEFNTKLEKLEKQLSELNKLQASLRWK